MPVTVDDIVEPVRELRDNACLADGVGYLIQGDFVLAGNIDIGALVTKEAEVGEVDRGNHQRNECQNRNADEKFDDGKAFLKVGWSACRQGRLGSWVVG